MKKKIMLLLIASFFPISSYADNMMFRIPMNGVKGNVETTPPIEENIPEEDEVVSAWEQFAIDNNLAYSDWNNLDWMSKGLTSLPNESYPISTINGDLRISYNNIDVLTGLSNITSVIGNLYLGNNNFTHVDSLSSLTQVGESLYLSNNNLINLNGLSSLVSVGHILSIHNNNLENIDGLSSLTSVGSSLTLYGYELSNINGLNNAVIQGTINISFTSLGTKLPANTTFCLENDASQFVGATKNQLCEF